MAEVEIKRAWRLHDAKIEQDAIAFWKRWNLLPANIDPQSRANELVAVACLGEDVVGVGTAVISPLPALRERFAVYRSAIAPEHRREWIGAQLLLASLALLERWSLEHPEERVMGLAMEVETDLGRYNREPIWPQTKLMIAGYTPRGNPLRLTWFEHARVD